MLLVDYSWKTRYLSHEAVQPSLNQRQNFPITSAATILVSSSSLKLKYDLGPALSSEPMVLFKSFHQITVTTVPVSDLQTQHRWNMYAFVLIYRPHFEGGFLQAEVCQCRGVGDVLQYLQERQSACWGHSGWRKCPPWKGVVGFNLGLVLPLAAPPRPSLCGRQETCQG